MVDHVSTIHVHIDMIFVVVRHGVRLAGIQGIGCWVQQRHCRGFPGVRPLSSLVVVHCVS